MFLDVVNTHLRLEYDSKNVSRISLKKNDDLDVKKLSRSNVFNVKSILSENKMDNHTLLNGFLSTDFYARINTKDHKVKFVSNFDNVVDHLFWTITKTESIHLVYDRKPKLYSEWDQLLGPLTLSKYDRMQFQFQCLKGFDTKFRIFF